MERKDRDTADKSKGEAQDGGGRLTGSIAMEAFSCRVCAQPLRSPIFQCPAGHFFCSSCHDKLPGNKCHFCSGCAPLDRSYGMERAVRSILLDCCYAKQGCTEKTAYYDKSEHEKACPHTPRFLCPEPGCGFAGSREELLDHITGTHKWPSMTFRYWTPFDLHIAQPGVQVLRCADDGQLFLVSVRQAVTPPGLAVSIVCVPPHRKSTGFGCTVSFSCFKRHRSTWTLDDLQTLVLSDWPPKEYICVVPKTLEGEGDGGAGAVLTVTIVCARDDDEDEDVLDDDDDDSDTDSDEDGTDSS